MYLLGKQNTWHFTQNTDYLNYTGQPFNAFEGTYGCLLQELLELQNTTYGEMQRVRVIKLVVYIGARLAEGSTATKDKD